MLPAFLHLDRGRMIYEAALDDPNDRVCPLGTPGLAVPDACPTILQIVSFVLFSQSFNVTCTSNASSVYLALFASRRAPCTGHN
jgi:hypothetical protein